LKLGSNAQPHVNVRTQELVGAAGCLDGRDSCEPAHQNHVLHAPSGRKGPEIRVKVFDKVWHSLDVTCRLGDEEISREPSEDRLVGRIPISPHRGVLVVAPP
jgi:hypothetical protein